MKTAAFNKRPGGQEGKLQMFLDVREKERLQIKETLRTRNFVGEHYAVARQAIDFLESAGSQLPVFQHTHNLATKTDFLRSLVHAWEIADATGTFNAALKMYSRILAFSKSCLDEIAAMAYGAKPPFPLRVYWQEVARAGIINIAELYRSQQLDLCLRELDRCRDFVERVLRDEKMRC